MLGRSVIILFKSVLHVFCSLVFSAHNSSDTIFKDDIKPHSLTRNKRVREWKITKSRRVIVSGWRTCNQRQTEAWLREPHWGSLCVGKAGVKRIAAEAQNVRKKILDKEPVSDQKLFWTYFLIFLLSRAWLAKWWRGRRTSSSSSTPG